MPDAIPLFLVFEASAEVTPAANDAAPRNDEEHS